MSSENGGLDSRPTPIVDWVVSFDPEVSSSVPPDFWPELRDSARRLEHAGGSLWREVERLRDVVYPPQEHQLSPANALPALSFLPFVAGLTRADHGSVSREAFEALTSLPGTNKAADFGACQALAARIFKFIEASSLANSEDRAVLGFPHREDWGSGKQTGKQNGKQSEKRKRHQLRLVGELATRRGASRLADELEACQAAVLLYRNLKAHGESEFSAKDELKQHATAMLSSLRMFAAYVGLRYHDTAQGRAEGVPSCEELPRLTLGTRLSGPSGVTFTMTNPNMPHIVVPVPTSPPEPPREQTQPASGHRVGLGLGFLAGVAIAVAAIRPWSTKDMPSAAPVAGSSVDAGSADWRRTASDSRGATGTKGQNGCAKLWEEDLKDRRKFPHQRQYEFGRDGGVGSLSVDELIWRISDAAKAKDHPPPFVIEGAYGVGKSVLATVLANRLCPVLNPAVKDASDFTKSKNEVVAPTRRGERRGVLFVDNLDRLGDVGQQTIANALTRVQGGSDGPVLVLIAQAPFLAPHGSPLGPGWGKGDVQLFSLLPMSRGEAQMHMNASFQKTKRGGSDCSQATEEGFVRWFRETWGPRRGDPWAHPFLGNFYDAAALRELYCASEGGRGRTPPGASAPHGRATLRRHFLLGKLRSAKVPGLPKDNGSVLAWLGRTVGRSLAGRDGDPLCPTRRRAAPRSSSVEVDDGQLHARGGSRPGCKRTWSPEHSLRRGEEDDCREGRPRTGQVRV